MAWTSPRTWSSEVMASATLNTHLRDNLLHICGTAGGLTISTVAPHSIGGAASDLNTQLTLQGTHSPSTTGIGLRLITTINGVANQEVYGMQIAPTLVEASSGTHANFVSALIQAPSITAGAGAVSRATTLFISGVPTAGTNNFGLYMEVGGNDGVHLAIADSVDVAHGVTTLAPTDVYCLIRKSSATAGGFSLQGYSEAETGASLVGVATTTITTEAGASRGAITFVANKANGTGVTTFAADDNIAVIINGTSATHIFKGNGDSYEDGTGWTAYDEHDDISLIEAVEYELTAAQGNPIKRQFSQWMVERRATIERLRLATFGEDGRIFVNRSGMQALICGFARQMTRRVMSLEARVAALEAVRG